MFNRKPLKQIVTPILICCWSSSKLNPFEALYHRKIVRYLFNASHQIICYEQTIQVYFDIIGGKFQVLLISFSYMLRTKHFTLNLYSTTS